MVNCSVPGCGVARTPKYEGTSIFKIPQRKNEFYTEWRKKLVNIIDKNRLLTPTFKKEVLECKRALYICERHFDVNDIIITPAGKKSLDDNAVPNPAKLPKKSFEIEMKERKPPKAREFLDVINNWQCISSG